MKRKYILRVLVSVILLCSISITTVYATVTQEQIDQAKDQVNNLQQQVNDAENVLDQFKDQKDNLEDDLDDFNTQLDKLVKDMNDLEDQIDVKQDEIATTTVELEEVERQVAKQYEDMMHRIQYMYENGSTSMLDAIFGSNSISEMLSPAERFVEM